MYVLLQLNWYLENSVKITLAYLICASSFFFISILKFTVKFQSFQMYYTMWHLKMAYRS